MCGTARPSDAACPQIVNQESQSPRPTLLVRFRGSTSQIPSNRGRVLAAIIVLTGGISLWIGTLQRTTPSAGLHGIKEPVIDSNPSVGSAPQDQAQPVTNTAVISEPAKASLRKTEIRQDPAELWKDVQHGNTEAEIQLALMYLDGTRVSQNCEQAHLLLLAAAKKQNVKSNNLLSHIYAQRCP